MKIKLFRKWFLDLSYQKLFRSKIRTDWHARLSRDDQRMQRNVAKSSWRHLDLSVDMALLSSAKLSVTQTGMVWCGIARQSVQRRAAASARGYGAERYRAPARRLACLQHLDTFLDIVAGIFPTLLWIQKWPSSKRVLFTGLFNGGILSFADETQGI